MLNFTCNIISNNFLKSHSEYILPVDFLADLYIHGETTYQIEEKGKVKSVTVNRTTYTLTEEALQTFEIIHDSWEKEICEKNPNDALIGGR